MFCDTCTQRLNKTLRFFSGKTFRKCRSTVLPSAQCRCETGVAAECRPDASPPAQPAVVEGTLGPRQEDPRRAPSLSENRVCAVFTLDGVCHGDIFPTFLLCFWPVGLRKSC